MAAVCGRTRSEGVGGTVAGASSPAAAKRWFVLNAGKSRLDLLYNLANREQLTAPFSHAVFHDVLPAELAEAALAWLEERTEWMRHERDFYRSHNVHLSPGVVRGGAAPMFDPQALAAFRTSLGELFQTAWDRSGFHISANRYSPDDGTLIHTDYVVPEARDQYYFTHRFILYLNRGWYPRSGGELGLFPSADATAPTRVIEPRHNTAAALAIGPRAYHAVACVQEGARYSINFCLRVADGS